MSLKIMKQHGILSAHDSIQEQLEEKSVAALVLQEGAEVQEERPGDHGTTGPPAAGTKAAAQELTAHPTLRLNSHLMELSMKARGQDCDVKKAT